MSCLEESVRTSAEVWIITYVFVALLGKFCPAALRRVAEGGLAGLGDCEDWEGVSRGVGGREC